MRIVFGTTDVPPDPGGMPYQRWTYALAQGLADRGHDVFYAAITASREQAERSRRAFTRSNVDLRIYPPPKRAPSLRGKLQTLRLPFSRCIPDDLRRDVRTACDRGYDILHLENFQWGSYLGWDMPRALTSIHMLNFIDWRDSGFRSLAFMKAKILLAWSEKRSLRRYEHIRVLTDGLGEVVRNVNPRARIYTVPIAINPDDYPVLRSNDAEMVVGLIGGMKFETSQRSAVRLLASIWPRVRRRMKGVRLLVGGWAAREVLARFLDEPGVEIVENVPSAAEFFRQCTVFAYPLQFGGGLKGKVLEALAHGVPLVTTTAGIEGVRAQSGIHAFIEDDDEAFAERICELLRDARLRRRMAEAGRALVEEHYAPAPVLDQIEAVYRSMLAG